MSNAVSTTWPSGSTNQGWPQEPTGMLMPGRIQGWPAGTQRAATPATTLLSQAVAWWDVESYREGDRFLRNRGTGGELLDLRLGSAAVANSNDPLYLAPEDQGYVYLPGLFANYLSTPDAAALDITSDLDVRVLVAPTTWTGAQQQTLAAKRQIAASEMSWQFMIQTDGKLALVHSSSGTAFVSVSTTTQSTAATGFAAGAAKWVRATLDVDNGASGHTYRYYTSDDGVTWTQLGNPVTIAGTTSIFSSTSIVEFGSTTGGTALLTAGRFYRAQILDGIDGTTVLDVDCDAITSGSATSFTAVTNQTVTVNRSTSGRKSVAVPSRHKGGRPVMLLGTDDYLEIPAENGWQHGLLNFGQGDSFTVLWVGRNWTNLGAGVLVAKRDSTSLTAGTEAGWMMRQGGIGGVLLNISDGVANVFDGSTDPSSGQLVVWSTTRGNRRLDTRLNAAAETPVSESVASTSNVYPLRIGRSSGSSTNYNNGEFYTAAIWRRALTAAEITTLSNWFTGRIA